MDRRWLLLLDSNLARDRCVHAGLRRLALLGEVTARTPVRRFPAHDGAGADYHNALAVLACDRDRAALEGAIKAIESALGRRPQAGVVAIDIDILACSDDAGCGWRADPHALEKREFDQAPVAALLAELGVSVTR